MILPLLRDRAVNDDEYYVQYYVREISINVLAQYWPTHPDTLPLLRKRTVLAFVGMIPTGVVHPVAAGDCVRRKAKDLVKQFSKDDILRLIFVDNNR